MHISTPIEINIHPHYTKYTHKCLQDWGCHFTFFFLYSYYFLPGVYCSLLSKWFIDWIELFRSHSSLNDTIPHVVPGRTQGFLVMETTFTSTFPRLPRKAKLSFVIMTQNIQGVHAGRCWGLREASKGEVDEKPARPGQVLESSVWVGVIGEVSVKLCIAEGAREKPRRFCGREGVLSFVVAVYLVPS